MTNTNSNTREGSLTVDNLMATYGSPPPKTPTTNLTNNSANSTNAGNSNVSFSVTLEIEDEDIYCNTPEGDRISGSVYASGTKTIDAGKDADFNVDIAIDYFTKNKTLGVSYGAFTLTSGMDEFSSGVSIQIGSTVFHQEISPRGLTVSSGHVDSKGFTTGVKVSARPGRRALSITLLAISTAGLSIPVTIPAVVVAAAAK